MKSTAVLATAAVVAVASLADGVSAFASSDRRAALGELTKVLGGAAAIAVGGVVASPGEASAMGNPAQMGRGKSTGGGQFIPGKGIRVREDVC
mmetsp:Transcript_15583/g.31525  ORF Transcript_15583/g.31525 Transcript_15583/m.31525 type:complete len:93 (+) Transcript_15583:110-388(+)